LKIDLSDVQGSTLNGELLAGDRSLRIKRCNRSGSIQQPPEFVFPMASTTTQSSAPQEVRVKMDGPAESVLDIMWVEFQR
jgi:hypothetical protein